MYFSTKLEIEIIIIMDNSLMLIFRIMNQLESCPHITASWLQCHHTGQWEAYWHWGSSLIYYYTFAMDLSISICLLPPRIDFNMSWKLILSKRAWFTLCGNENMTISPADLHFRVPGHEASSLREWDLVEILLSSYPRIYFSVPSRIKGEDKAVSL